MEKEITPDVEFDEFLTLPNKEYKNVAKDNCDVLIKKIKDKKFEADSQFLENHGALSLFVVKWKLKRYIKKSQKASEALLKYNTLHSSLSLAIIAGFLNIKDYQKYTKILSEKTIEKVDNKRSEITTWK